MDEQSGGNTAAINSRSANYAVVNRIRDLAKWLVLVFGAIGGAMLTGVQLSDLGSVDGETRLLAILGVAIGIFAATAILWFTVRVLLPIHLSLEEVDNESMTSEVVKRGYPNVAELITAKTVAREAEGTVAAKYENAEPPAKNKKTELDKVRERRKRVDDDAADFLSWVLSERVRGRMELAIGVIFIGALVAAFGIGLFSWETSKSESESKIRGEATPKRASGVTVHLTTQGREGLGEALGRHCGTAQLRAVALGGPPDALEMVSVPTPNCVSARFTLTPSVGTVTNEKRLRALRACNADLEVPCVVYRNTPASVTDQVADSAPTDERP